MFDLSAPLRAVAEAAAATAPLFTAPALTARWNQPSALTEFPVSGLAGHLARALFTLRTAVESPSQSFPEPGRTVTDAVGYLTLIPPDPAGTELGRQIRDRGAAEAAAGPLALTDRYRDTLGWLTAELPSLDPECLVPALSVALPLHEYAVTRLIELVVHADDLAVSLDVPGPEFAAPVTDLVVSTLAVVATRRHGGRQLVRALARTERASGAISAF